MQNQCQNIDHFPIPTKLVQHEVLEHEAARPTIICVLASAA